MDRFRFPPASGGTRAPFTERFLPLALLALVGVLLFGGLAILGTPAGASPGGLAAPRLALSVAPAGPAPLVATHGDLEVDTGTVVIGTVGAVPSIYYQGGNISVASGATLVFNSVTLDFVQFIGSTGDAGNRASHIYTISDSGTIVFSNSAVTTDTTILNPYSQLTVNVNSGGTMDLNSSVFAFPGWISITGPNAFFNATNSTIMGNPAVTQLNESLPIRDNTIWAPSLTVSSGGHALLAASRFTGVYKDFNTHGLPEPNPISSSVPQTISSGGGATWNTWATLTDSENLSLDLSSPTVTSGWISYEYSTSVSQTAASSSLTWGASYPLGTVAFSSSGSEATTPLTAAVIAAINSQGIPAFLDASGAFGDAATLGVTVGATNQATGVDISSVSISLYSNQQYNVTVAGAGSVFTAVDSSIDLNWNVTPGTPVANGSFLSPAASNKLLLEGGATAYLANLTIPTAFTGGFWWQSAVIPDASSTANFYRWLAVPVLASGSVPIPDVTVSAFYAYSNAAFNSTATGLNSLATANPDLWGYVKTLNSAGYGISDQRGIAQLLLASGQLGQVTLPDGNFLGDYHVAVNLGGSNPVTQWGYASVAPYPSAMAPSVLNFSAPFVFPTYVPGISIGSVSVTVASTPAAEVLIGQTMEVSVHLTNSGQGPIVSSVAQLGYDLKAPFQPIVVAGPVDVGALSAGASRDIEFNWTVNESITGALGTFGANFTVTAIWNGGTGPTGGSVSSRFPVTIGPSQIQLIVTPLSGTVNPGAVYAVSGSLAYNGTGLATINVSAVASDGAVYLIGAVQSQSGPLLIPTELTNGMPGGTYSFNASATYNTRTVYVTYQNAFTVPGPATTPPSFLDQTFLGLKVLYWILIAVGIVAAILVALFLLRQTARGKLVECGECGQLIPENALACPKCGAEFETELVRCSRCGSTIPARSMVCPECAAQLIGKPEEATRDPERQGYTDFVERFRGEAKKELGDNYSEGAFWDWWKRQPTYLAFSQWKLQQQQGVRTGMTAPPAGASGGAAPSAPPTQPRRPGGGAGGGAATTATVTRPAQPTTPTAPPRASAPPTGAAAPAPVPAQAAMKACSNCGKEIPPEYLVCPFCGAVTQ